MNRGNITPQPQIGASYLAPDSQEPAALPFPLPPASTQIPMIVAAACGPVTSYFPRRSRRMQTWGSTILLPAMAA